MFRLFWNAMVNAVMKRAWLVVLCVGCLMASAAVAQDASVAPLMRLLQSGRLPAERLPQVLDMVCQRGGPDELKAVLEQILSGDKLSPAARAKALDSLSDAAETRKVKPAGDLAAIQKLLAPSASGKDQVLTLAAIRAVSAWQLESLAGDLEKVAADEKAAEKLRRAAISGLANIGGKEAQKTLATMAATENAPVKIRFEAAAALARIDTDAGAKAAAEILAVAKSSDDPTLLLTTFFQLKDGATKLAAALKGAKLEPDVAKQSLRTMFAIGSSDAELSDLLSSAAGLTANPKPPTQEEALVIAKDVSAKGDAARGEKVFRRADLSCMNCHAVSRAGGQIGPELSAVGRISPVDYIVTSILNPNLAIKEQFVTRIIETSDGKVVTGVVANRDDNRVELKTADGKLVVIPTSDIELEEEGKSLMPQGITKFLTQQEFYDLAKFVSELGKDGAYALPTVPAIQRWRLLVEPSAELLAETPNVEQVREYLLDTPADDWKSVYSKVNGELPLADVRGSDEAEVMYLMGEVAVTVEGEVTLQVESTEKVSVWVDASPFETQTEITTTLAAGKHKLLFRIERSESEEPKLRVRLTKPAGSSAQFDVVGGA